LNLKVFWFFEKIEYFEKMGKNLNFFLIFGKIGILIKYNFFSYFKERKSFYHNFRQKMSFTNEESITKPIIYGSMSFWLGKKADEKASHKWVCYVRGVNNEDLSYFIKKVVFTLHPSFKIPVRSFS